MFTENQIVTALGRTAFVVTPGSVVTEVSFPGVEETTWLPTPSITPCAHENNSVGRDNLGRLTGASCLRCDEDTTALVRSRMMDAEGGLNA